MDAETEKMIDEFRSRMEAIDGSVARSRCSLLTPQEMAW